MPVPTPDIVVELTQLIDGHGRRQRELLVLIRRLRTSLTEVSPVVSAAGVGPAGHTVVDRWQREVLGSGVRPTKHDYDYFGDLDRRLSAFTRW